ncbi:glycosyltransferase family 2 protein [Dokdonella fugitiva]|jgi:glycosyltransferase involved in cell wall biosynthesis|uniref:Glycosyltransferase involved in cell wall biosynthesis n=1 Tax=Dokdonella fugitiva TaxID=328517 RepID=A0A4R2IF13_9GAMM|nr:glycosyltransferase family 2 protein [Dokdonella fugitiva]MBA8882422.1 glycosyltransferase involved in cell wall biosynthesis [Dokdonella fugitiva]TCO42782.1 glycosyltransferase involved in cell wall biosynthesis [Dokdonella fugitiva]
MPKLTVVVPAYNESEGLREFHARLAAVLDRLDLDTEVLYVDDGSRDDTWAVMCALRDADARVSTLRLSRNFGKELALTAGLDHVDADAAVVIDADLQDPPELIPTFVRHWREGYDVVYGTRASRAGETGFKKMTASGFYRVMERLSSTPIPRDTGDFRLISRRALAALGQVRERQRFMKGLFTWVGFRQVAVVYHRDPRHAGETKWNYWKLWNFAIDGITSFSSAPLKLATYIGLAASLVAFGFALWVLGKALLFGDPVRGYPSLMVVVLFLGGLQLMALGVIGEYLGRLYVESKQRPLYLVDEYHPSVG